MDFLKFKHIISEIETAKLAGFDAQVKLAPKIRKSYSNNQVNSKKPKIAAVLVVFYPNKNGTVNFLLTQRASYKGTHSAQISFPGGKVEETDTSLMKTALRESNEEVGLKEKDVFVFKEMTNLYIPPSNFLVTPFLSYINYTPIFTKNREVNDLIEVKLSDFLNDNAMSSTTLSTSYAKKMEVPCYKLNSYIVWGATAMMLSEIKELLKKYN
ncbi:NUDIX hydrolase [Lutibacter citreus]|uniref:NUDIX hydrolase n=1 Tax=Lutibacter citreus TaxID=2138210 RepID=UPI000DBE37A8|nr:CoA pyrophosphatase [Lutibacter citreus]